VSEVKKTLRDEFAIAALQGMLAGDLEYSWGRQQHKLAQEAYFIADKMIKERGSEEDKSGE